MTIINPKPISDVISRYDEYIERLSRRRRPAPKNMARKTPFPRTRFIDGEDITTHAEALEFLDWAYNVLRGMGYTVTAYLDSFDIESSYYTYLQDSVNTDGTKSYRLRDLTRARLLALRTDLARKVTIHNGLVLSVSPPAPEPEPVPTTAETDLAQIREYVCLIHGDNADILEELKKLNEGIAALLKVWS